MKNHSSRTSLLSLEKLESRRLLDGHPAVLPFGSGEANVIAGGAADDLFVLSPDSNDLIEFVPQNFDNSAVIPQDVVDDPHLGLPPTTPLVLSESEVSVLLERATAATGSDDAIVSIVDRHGRVLGIRVENGVSNQILGNSSNLIFAIDGALAKARAAAFFSSNEATLTSRSVQNLSQSTVTQRQVNSRPSNVDVNSLQRGPGKVAPIGVGDHFSNGADFNPHVDLFDIESTNRDSIFAVGPDNIKGTLDDIRLLERFNVNPAHYRPDIPIGQRLTAPESYGFFSGTSPHATARGIGTLPGGIPIYKIDDLGNSILTGGIGVFFPGNTGYASESNSTLGADHDPNLPDRSFGSGGHRFCRLGGNPWLRNRAVGRGRTPRQSLAASERWSTRSR